MLDGVASLSSSACEAYSSTCHSVSSSSSVARRTFGTCTTSRAPQQQDRRVEHPQLSAGGGHGAGHRVDDE
jgi:hypothetical protein